MRNLNLSSLQSLIDSTVERLAKYSYSFSPPDDHPAHQGGAWWVGTYAWTSTQKKFPKRIITKKHLCLDGYITPTDIAQTLFLSHAKGKRVARRFDQDFCSSLPLLARPGIYPDMVYVDLRSAYARIISAVGLTVDYYPGKWLRGEPIALPSIPKLSYSALVAMSRSRESRLRLFADGSIKMVRVKNPYFNSSLFNLARDVLASIASDIVIHTKAVYVHTDGYIVPYQYLHVASEIIATWGFDYKIKLAGDAVVHGVAAYSIGGYSTKRTYDTPQHQYRFPHPPTRVKEFLRSRFPLFAASIPDA